MSGVDFEGFNFGLVAKGCTAGWGGNAGADSSTTGWDGTVWMSDACALRNNLLSKVISL